MRKRVVDLLEVRLTASIHSTICRRLTIRSCFTQAVKRDDGRLRLSTIEDLRPAFKFLSGLQTANDLAVAQAARSTEQEDNLGAIDCEFREVWRHLGFLGQFCDSFLINTELDVCSKSKSPVVRLSPIEAIFRPARS